MAKSSNGGAFSPPKNTNDVLKLMKDEDIKIVDFRFLDFIGMWQHFSTPSHELDNESFEDGLGFDGSSIRGWQSIHASDMLVIPDPQTARVAMLVNGSILAV